MRYLGRLLPELTDKWQSQISYGRGPVAGYRAPTLTTSDKK